MSLGTLSIDLEARLAKLEEGMGKAARLTEQQSARMDAAIQRSQAVAQAAGVAIAGALSVAGLAGFVRSTADAVDALNDVKDATGASIENISALEMVAMNAGGTLDDVSGILVKFNGLLKEADEENGVGQALEAIGLNAEELKRIDPAEALRQTAVALSRFADDGNKARITQELFGKSVKEAAPFLNELAQQTELVGRVTGEQAEQAEKFNKVLFRMEANASALSRSLVMKVIPALDNMLERFNRDGVGATLVETLKERLGVDELSQLELAARANSARIARVVGEMTRLSEVVKVNPNAVLEATVGPNGNAAMLASERIKQLRGEYDQLQRSAAQLRGSLVDKADARGGASRVLVGPVLPADMRPSVSEVVGSKAPAALRNVRTARGAGGRTSEIDPEAAYRANLLERLTDEWHEVEKASRAASEELERYVERLADDKGRADAAALDRATALFEATMTPAEKLKVVLAEVNALYAQGAILSDQWGTAEEKRDRIIAAAKATMDGQRDSMDELSDAAKSFADTMLRAMENGDDLGDALERIAAKKLIFDPLSKAIDGLFDSLAKGVSAGGSSASGGGGAGGSDFLDAAIRAAMMFFGGGFADGGTPPLGKVSLVGERGPELFVPKQLGTVIPNHLLGGGAAAAAPQVTVINHVTAGAQIGHSDLAAAMALTKQQTEASIIRTLRGRGVPV